MTLQGFN